MIKGLHLVIEDLAVAISTIAARLEEGPFHPDIPEELKVIARYINSVS